MTALDQINVKDTLYQIAWKLVNNNLAYKGEYEKGDNFSSSLGKGN